MHPSYDNVLCSIDIPIKHATTCAGELEGMAIPLCPTLMTGLRGIGRIDQDNRDPRILRLVDQELPELIEGPTVLVVALGFTALGALPTARAG